MIRNGLFEKVMLEQTPGWSESAHMWIFGGESITGRGNYKCKGSEHILGAAWRPVCLSTGEGRQAAEKKERKERKERKEEKKALAVL